MSFSVVWIDLEHAKLFHFSDDQMKREVLHSSRVNLYEDLAKRLVNEKKILILGPGTARVHFLNHLKEKHQQTAECVVGCEVSDHPTDQQIAAKALEFFGLRPGGQRR